MVWLSAAVEMFFQRKHIHHLLYLLHHSKNRLSKRKRVKEKQKNDVTEVTQSAASERGNGKIRNCFRGKREGEKAIKDVRRATLKRAETKDEDSSLKMEEERFPAELITLGVKGTVHPHKKKKTLSLFAHPRVLRNLYALNRICRIFSQFLPYNSSSYFHVWQAPKSTKTPKKGTTCKPSEALCEKTIKVILHSSYSWGSVVLAPMTSKPGSMQRHHFCK